MRLEEFIRDAMARDDLSILLAKHCPEIRERVNWQASDEDLINEVIREIAQARLGRRFIAGLREVRSRRGHEIDTQSWLLQLEHTNATISRPSQSAAPYPGPVPFARHEHGCFFGREAMVEKLRAAYEPTHCL